MATVTTRRRTKADLLKDLRAGFSNAIDESALVQDVPYMLQAISTPHVTFPEAASGVRRKLTVSFGAGMLPPGLAHLLATVVEMGLLYRKLSDYTSAIDASSHADGLVVQSFRASLAEELTAYLTKVSAVESEVRQGLSQDESTPRVTLKRVAVWVSEDLLRLRLMNTLVDAVVGPSGHAHKGGAAINVVHAISRHGDPFVQDFSSRILRQMSRPFYAMLAKWVFEGELVDPHQEFLVRAASPTSAIKTSRSRAGAGEDAWQGKYTLVDELVPVWLSTSLAQKIFLIGKSLNFIRHACHDDAYVAEHARTSPAELTIDTPEVLEATVEQAYKETSHHLKHLLVDKLHLLDHLLALKKYILLNAGDFSAILMEALADSLARPAHTLHGHNLTSALSDAIQTSNAHHEPDHVLRRLDARMVEGARGTIGWDVFTLEYRLGKPLDAVVTSAHARSYLKLFNFLWRLKRVEHDLGVSWRRNTTAERGMMAAVPSTRSLWKQTRGLAAEMIHFVTQLQYYILFEVVESSWSILATALAHPDADLDAMAQAHDAYIRNILHKALLATDHPSQNQDQDNLAALHEILKLILLFVGQQDALYKHTLALYHRRPTAFSSSAGRRGQGRDYESTRDETTDGGVGEVNAGDGGGGGGAVEDEGGVLIGKAIGKTSVLFRRECGYLLGKLYASPSQEMKMLAVRLNFNDFYPIPRIRPTASTTQDQQPS
ncbi:Microtubule-nucleating Tub4p (gamma-tubulin) complex component [Savitreella phatthalungensis]